MLQCARKVRGVPAPQTIFVLFLLVAICQLLRRGDLKTLFDDGAIMPKPAACQLDDQFISESKANYYNTRFDRMISVTP